LPALRLQDGTPRTNPTCTTLADHSSRRSLGPIPGLLLFYIHVYLAYLAASQQLYEKYGQAADPWLTLVGYSNSMRELGGMRL
jgi:hypothetical protein